MRSLNYSVKRKRTGVQPPRLSARKNYSYYDGRSKSKPSFASGAAATRVRNTGLTKPKKIRQVAIDNAELSAAARAATVTKIRRIIEEEFGSFEDFARAWDRAEENADYLHIAAEEGGRSVVKYLIEAGASPSQRDDLGRTPCPAAHQAFMSAKKNSKERKRREAIVNDLLPFTNDRATRETVFRERTLARRKLSVADGPCWRRSCLHGSALGQSRSRRSLTGRSCQRLDRASCCRADRRRRTDRLSARRRSRPDSGRSQR